MSEPSEQNWKEFVKWLREDLQGTAQRMERAAERLEQEQSKIWARLDEVADRSGPERPCPELKQHLEGHEKARERWWSFGLRVGAQVFMDALVVLGALWAAIEAGLLDKE